MRLLGSTPSRAEQRPNADAERVRHVRQTLAHEYSSALRTRVAGVNAIAEVHAGAPGLAHLRVV